MDDPEGAWLVYADAYDPRWRAWVDAAPAPVVPAYVGLKAVRIPRGDHVVRMEFGGSARVGMSALAAGGAACSLSLLAYCALCCITGFPSAQLKVRKTRSPVPIPSRPTSPAGSGQVPGQGTLPG